eukprot:scaffold78444_cov64-Phaeocystis_antarctica.AAC.2
MNTTKESAADAAAVTTKMAAKIAAEQVAAEQAQAKQKNVSSPRVLFFMSAALLGAAVMMLCSRDSLWYTPFFARFFVDRYGRLSPRLLSRDAIMRTEAAPRSRLCSKPLPWIKRTESNTASGAVEVAKSAASCASNALNDQQRWLRNNGKPDDEQYQMYDNGGRNEFTDAEAFETTFSGDLRNSKIDGVLKKMHSSYAVAKSAFIGGLLVLSFSPGAATALPSPPPVFALLFMMFGLSDAQQCQMNPFTDEGYPSYFSLDRTQEGLSSKSLETEFCNYDTENDFATTAQMITRCKQFCPEASIPALIGSATFGLSFKQATKTVSKLMDPDVTDVLKDFNRTEFRQCLADRNAFHAIKQSGANFVGQLDEFDASVLLYRNSIRDTITEATLALDSRETRDRIQYATGDEETIQVIIDVYNDAIDLKSSASLREMEDKLTALSDSASSLQTNLAVQVESAESFVSQCASKLWPPSDGQALLDVCTRKGSKCINVAYAQHVSCGCLVNLAADVGVEVQASTVLGGRPSEKSVGTTVSIDICASGKQQASPYVASCFARMGTSTVIAERETELANEYGSFYCSAVGSRQLHELTVDPAELPAEPAPPAERRGLEETCQANPFVNEGYPSYLSLERDTGGLAGVDYCSFDQETRFKTTAQMITRCENFCPANSIPALVGSATFGLSFKQAAETVAKLTNPNITNALKSFSRDEYTGCLDDRNAFHTIKAYGAAFIKQLYEFDAAVLVYRSATLDTIQRTTSELDSQATRYAIQSATGDAKKIQVIVDLYDRVIASNEAGAQQEMARKLEELKRATIEFKKNLSTELIKAQRFVTSCSTKFWPPPSGKALLDICTITGTKCVNIDEAQHATCGCLVNLATDVGVQSITNATIDVGRRLQSTTISIDMCAEARRSASMYVQDVSARLVSAGHTNLINENVATMRAQYGPDYCSPFRLPSPSPLPSPSMPPTPSPPPSPPSMPVVASDSSSDLHPGIIAGIVIGAFVGVICIIFCVVAALQEAKILDYRTNALQ